MYCLLSYEQGASWTETDPESFASRRHFCSCELPLLQDRAKIELKLRPAPETVGTAAAVPPLLHFNVFAYLKHHS